MAPEFFPFFAFIGLAIVALMVFVVGAALVFSARRKRERRVLATLVFSVVAAIVVVLFLIGAQIRQQFFLNEPFVVACGEGDVAEAVWLLSAGASPDAYGIDFTQTALIAASQSGHREIVELLLSKGATVSLKDSAGKTALQRAKESNHRDIVLLLEQAEESQPE